MTDADDPVLAGLLEAIRDHDIGFTHRGLAGTSYRWWQGEHDYRLLTPRERRALLRLLADGRVRHRSGWRPHKGFVLMAGDGWL